MITFGTLNLEHCELTTAGTYFQIDNETTLNIGALHFEGNITYADTNDSSIFRVSTTSASSININNIHINQVTQASGRLFLVGLTNTPTGSFTVNSISGVSTSNSFNDFRILSGSNANSYTVNILNADNQGDYFTSFYAGGTLTDFFPNIWLGKSPLSVSAAIANHSSATINVGRGHDVTMTGTLAAMTTLTATAAPGEKTRIITINNNAAASTIANTDNIDIGGRTNPVTWGNANTKAIFVYNFDSNKASLIGVK